jgi:hypothetical protein
MHVATASHLPRSEHYYRTHDSCGSCVQRGGELAKIALEFAPAFQGQSCCADLRAAEVPLLASLMPWN